MKINLRWSKAAIFAGLYRAWAVCCVVNKWKCSSWSAHVNYQSPRRNDAYSVCVLTLTGSSFWHFVLVVCSAASRLVEETQWPPLIFQICRKPNYNIGAQVRKGIQDHRISFVICIFVFSNFAFSWHIFLKLSTCVHSLFLEMDSFVWLMKS